MDTRVWVLSNGLITSTHMTSHMTSHVMWEQGMVVGESDGTIVNRRWEQEFTCTILNQDKHYSGSSMNRRSALKVEKCRWFWWFKILIGVYLWFSHCLSSSCVYNQKPHGCLATNQTLVSWPSELSTLCYHHSLMYLGYSLLFMFILLVFQACPLLEGLLVDARTP